MTMRPMLAALPLILLAAPAAAQPRAGETITYATGACFGICPVYSVTIDTRTGQGTFTGEQHTAVTGERAFTATRAQLRRFRAALESARALPPGSVEMGGARCRQFATDMPTVTLAWNGPRGARTLPVYLGCGDAANRTLFAGVRAAPSTLPIAGFIGERRTFQR